MKDPQSRLQAYLEELEEMQSHATPRNIKTGKYWGIMEFHYGKYPWRRIDRLKMKINQLKQKGFKP